MKTRAENRRFRPFTVHGKAVRVCARELFAYPDDRRARIPTRSHARIVERSDQAAQDDTARAVADAIARRDLAAFARLVPPDAVLSAIWFDDAACARQFSGSFAPTDRIRAALVTCLAGLELQAGPSRRILPWADPRPTLVYGPGVVLWLTVRDGAVIDIDTEWEDTADPSAAPVSSDALEAHLVAPVAVEPDAAVREALDSPGARVAFAQLLACVDRTGKLESLRTVFRSKDHDSYVHAVEAAAARWKFTPFRMRNKPVRVCGLALFAYPPDRRDEVFPMPPPPPPPPLPEAVIPQNVPPAELDAGRVAGEKNIVPDDATKNEIARSGKHRVLGSYKVCISTEGNVFSVKQLRTTTFPAYDAKIMKTIREGWRYRPFTVKGKAVPVCTAVTFVYSQQDWKPPLPAPAPAPRP